MTDRDKKNSIFIFGENVKSNHLTRPQSQRTIKQNRRHHPQSESNMTNPKVQMQPPAKREKHGEIKHKKQGTSNMSMIITIAQCSSTESRTRHARLSYGQDLTESVPTYSSKRSIRSRQLSSVHQRRLDRRSDRAKFCRWRKIRKDRWSQVIIVPPGTLSAHQMHR